MAVRVLKKSYEAIKEEELRKHGGVFLKFRSSKRERRKQETIKAIVAQLPSTLQVLYKRTGLSKTCLKDYLVKLVSVGVVIRELDMYRLDADFSSLNPNAPPRMFLIWDRWLTLPEYSVPKVLEPNKKGLAFRLALRGHKPIGDTKTKKRKFREYKKKREKGALG